MRGLFAGLGFLAAASLTLPSARRPDSPVPAGRILIEYPEEGTVFPPDFAPPMFLWRELPETSDSWQVRIEFEGDAFPLTVAVAGEPLQPGPIDPAAVGPTNRLPELAPEDRFIRTWRPDDATWRRIREGTVERWATLNFTGLRRGQPVSAGAVRVRTSKDPVGAPIFFRDVPLMPSETEKGVIKPLAPKLLPLVRWRLRYVDELSSRVVLERLHTCANCHSFSADGRTLGMDFDGPHNDKGLYAIVPVHPRTVIRQENVISWKRFRGQMEREKRIGFMSQVSPDGRYVVTATQVQYYVANFKDYRFLQVFYPTRGILAFYDRTEGVIRPLPGADDPAFVHSNAVWSPDGSYLVFVRAPATDPYPEGRKLAEYPNDPNEVQIRYDLWRIPFNGGKGGRAEPVRGASRNGMSNSFPRISPDGKWIVFVKCRNGQLMRPDGELWIVPAAGGEARRMRCNTRLMNSWHSFSPNGRWMVFSSKSRSPYTQMFLTHIDEQGNDSPAVLIENATESNRAVNIPEFVNIPKGGLEKIDAPAAEFYRLYDLAYELGEKGDAEGSIRVWREALHLEPDEAKAHNNLGGLLLRAGRLDEAEEHLRAALRADESLSNARSNLGLLLMQRQRWSEARRELERALELNPDSAEARVNLGGVLLVEGRHGDAAAQLRKALALEPWRTAVMVNLAWILATCPDGKVRHAQEAVILAERAAALTRRRDVAALDALAAAYAEEGRFDSAINTAEEAWRLARESGLDWADEIRERIALYRQGRPYRAPR